MKKVLVPIVVVIVILLCLLIVFGFKNVGGASMSFDIKSTEEVDTNEANMDSRILFARRQSRGQGWSIYSIAPDGSSESVLIPAGSGQGEYNPSIAPDGASVLFNTYRYGGWKLASFDLESEKTSRVTMGSVYYTNGTYSPDGEYMVYEKNQRTGNHICVADKTGNNERKLTASMGGAENRVPVWTPDGKKAIFFSDKPGIHDIYSVEIANGKLLNLTKNSAGSDFAPAVSPDGSKIAFYSDRDGYLDVFTMDPDGSNQTNLTKSLHNEVNQYNYYKDNNTFWFFKVAWSPDGKQLVFSGVADDQVDLFTMNRDGSAIRQITSTPQSEFTPAWGMLQR